MVFIFLRYHLFFKLSNLTQYHAPPQAHRQGLSRSKSTAIELLITFLSPKTQPIFKITSGYRRL